MPAELGNKYAIGNSGGRPRIYESAEELAKQVDECFEYINGANHTEVDENTKLQVEIWDRRPEPATVTGLALFLGFESRKSLIDYQGNEEFSSIIKRARARVEHEYEKRLSTDKPTGPIFALKNMGWADNSQITGANGQPLFPTSVTLNMPPGTEINLPSNIDGEE